MDGTASAVAPTPKVKKATVEVPREENSLYEICLRTQQDGLQSES